MLKVFYAKGFPGHWPVGTSAVVVAENKAEAFAYFKKEAQKNHGLDGNKLIKWMSEQSQLDNNFACMVEIDTRVKQAIVLQDGEY